VTNTNTYKGMAIAMGVGLAILWIAGLSSPYAPAWFTWLDGVAAFCAFVIAGTNQSYDTRAKRMGGPIALAAGLYALWVIGLATGAVAWLSWWTFAFACAFLIFGVTAGGAASLPEVQEPMQGPEVSKEEHREIPEKERYRKAG
jgi:hypothetical protein